MSYSESAYENYNKVRALDARAAGEFPSSNNLRLQNLVESQLDNENGKLPIALSANFALGRNYASLCIFNIDVLMYSF
ncbi:hypothetical protein F2Q68_00015723 [Brassica cretica]|uniref:Uncharacterized protein n=2 Tax=Brassica cretica TaxID=69181 RepID=A0A8S9HG04_BRACR|nr:hypothetical protein F2Q68_00015723 [Brassica cretica]KAF3605219.1 hypothetical protein DY000_02048299 [Brassica cretica]